MKNIKNKVKGKVKKINSGDDEKEETMKKYFDLQQEAADNYEKDYKKRHGFTLKEYVDYMQRRKEVAKPKRMCGFRLK